MFKLIKFDKIHTNLNDSKLTLVNKIIYEKERFLSIQNQFKNRTLRFRFLQTLSYLPIF